MLSRDVHGDMREKQLETIEIEDIDGDIDDNTVMRFIEYAYSGDYTVPNPDIVQLSTDSKELQEAFKSDISPGLEEDEWAVSTTKSKKDKKKKRSSTTFGEWYVPSSKLDLEPVVEAESEIELERPLEHWQDAPSPTLQIVDMDRHKLWKTFCSQAHTVQRPPWRPRDGNDQREDYTGIFLCHTRLYKFADRYGCAELMTLTLQKLRLTLTKYRVHVERMSDVIELIRYTYTHTMDHDQGRRQDRLRVLVLDFAVCYLHSLAQHPSFRKLLEEGGPLSSDLLVRVVDLVS